MRTKTAIAGVEFSSYVLNASGPDDMTLEQLEKIGSSGAAAIVTKSCTLEPREGNPEPRYIEVALGSINSMGLPNLGYKAYLDMIPKLKQFNKPIIVSISGLSLDDNITMVKAFQESDCDLIEVNLSCPNVVGKPQTAYDFPQAEKTIAAVTSIPGTKPVGVKLSPYFDFIHMEQMANIIKKYPVKFLTLVNSIGNGLIIDPEKEQPLIKPKGGFGGIGGDYIKPTALANVRKFYELLNGHCAIFGCGGVKTGTDAFEFVLAGADAVQIGTQFAKEGPACFARIDKELNDILERKGYKSIADAKGRLKPLA